MSINISNESKKFYEPIPGVKNIVTMLVDNIYNDEIYQKYLKKLEKSNEFEQKKASIIKKTFTEIKVFNTAMEPLFLSRDIGILMGISHINGIVKKYDDNEKITGYIKTSNGKIKQMLFLTRFGIYRTFLTSRSKLSTVFRNFIYKLLDYMILNENDKLNKLIEEFQYENPEMIKESLQELNNNYIKYKELYEEEHNDKIIWQSKAEKEHLEKLYLEKQNNELDALNTYNEMFIYKVSKENEQYSFKVRNLKIENQMKGFNEINNKELDFLKKKFLKEIQIYIIIPDYLKKVINHEDITNDNNSQFNDEFLSVYKNNYLNIISSNNENEYKVDLDEILFFRITFGKKINKNKYMYILTEWIPDKPSFNVLIDLLKQDSDWFNPIDKPNEFIFKTNLENIKLTIHQLFCENI
jgi:prophage antirepressor-like protein